MTHKSNNIRIKTGNVWGSILCTSPAKSVRISPIAFSPTRNMICIQQPKKPKRQAKEERLANGWFHTFEKRLFSIFWAIDNFKASGSVRSRMFLCFNRSSHHQRHETLQRNVSHCANSQVDSNKNESKDDQMKTCLASYSIMNWNLSHFLMRIIVLISRLQDNCILSTANHSVYPEWYWGQGGLKKLSTYSKPPKPSIHDYSKPKDDYSPVSNTQLNNNLGVKFRYISRTLSRSFFLVVRSATISLTWAMIVPKSDTEQRNRKTQKTWGKQNQD